MNQIVIYMSGIAAEEIIFGKDYVSIGGQGDISEVTLLASWYIRKYGMGRYDSHIIESPNKYDPSYGVF